jgi:hypothetical protein
MIMIFNKDFRQPRLLSHFGRLYINRDRSKGHAKFMRDCDRENLKKSSAARPPPYPSFILPLPPEGVTRLSFVVAGGGRACSSACVEDQSRKAPPRFWVWCARRSPRRGGYPTCGGVSGCTPGVAMACRTTTWVLAW